MAVLDRMLDPASDREPAPPPVPAPLELRPDDALTQAAELFRTVFKGEIVP